MSVVSGATRANGSTTVSGHGIPGMIFEHNLGVTMTNGAVLRVNVCRPVTHSIQSDRPNIDPTTHILRLSR